MHHVLMVAAGGAAGAVSRYLVSIGAFKLFGPAFPFGTLLVNASGSFLIGLIWALSDDLIHLSPGLRTLVFIGFLGGFTTFSSYSLETINLAKEGAYLKAGVNIFANNILCLVLVLSGFALARYFSMKIK